MSLLPLAAAGAWAHSPLFWGAAGLLGLSAGLLAWALAAAFAEGAQAQAQAYESAVGQTLEAMFLFVPARRIVELGWLCAGTAFLVAMLPFCRVEPFWALPAGLAVAGSLAAGAFFLPRVAVNRLRKRRRDRFDLQLLEALPMMSNALRAGFSVNQAFESVAEGTDPPMRQEIALFLQQLRVGVSFYDALAALDRRVGSEDLTLVCTAIDIARRTGGNLTEIFDAIAATIRDRLRIRQHVRSLTAQGRLQGLVIGAMPFLLGAGMAIFKPSLMLPFACSLAGAATLLAVTLLVALGGLMIRKIVTIDI